MPATAGRVRMPASNRVAVSDTLKTSEIWQKSVKYDPYAPANAGAECEEEKEAAAGILQDKAKGLFALARLTGNTSAVTPGGCRKCGQLGHLTYQCRNLMTCGGRSDESRRALAALEAKQAQAEEDEEDYINIEAQKKMFGVESESESDATSSSESTSSSEDETSSSSSSSSSDSSSTEEESSSRRRRSSNKKRRKSPPVSSSRKKKARAETEERKRRK